MSQQSTINAELEMPCAVLYADKAEPEPPQLCVDALGLRGLSSARGNCRF